MSPNAVEALGEVSGSRVGLIGYGAVPKRLTPVLRAMGAEVQFWNRTARPGEAALQVSLEELLATSDIVSLHVPLEGDTRHLLDRRKIARMKQGAVVVNTARGQLIDQVALVEALREGRLAGAGLDVFEAEPVGVVEALALAGCPTLVMTPHIAWLTPATLERSLVVALENCRRLRDGEALLNEVQG
jgi:phosphoglycerate dehydrogenase-like enzyme